tara:strand:- start:4205 stop:5908 length:1704 start_codon:yes stop_codon:yes gene_type:complete
MSYCNIDGAYNGIEMYMGDADRIITLDHVVFSNCSFSGLYYYWNFGENNNIDMSVNINNSTFYNSSLLFDADLGLGNPPDLSQYFISVKNSVFGGNESSNIIINTTDDNLNNIDFSYNLFDNNYQLWYPFGNNIIEGDPLFNEPQNNNFTLQLYSPSVDAGDPDSPLDPDGTVADMGAFYHHHLNMELSEGWNLVGLPLENESSHISDLFPGTSESFAYTYEDGSYTSTANLEIGRGYWIRYDEDVSFRYGGSPFTTVNVSVNEGYNLISGVSETVYFENIYDPDNVLLEGTLYEYNVSYVPSDKIEPGKGYWVRASGDGEITITSFFPPNEDEPTLSSILEDAHCLKLTNADNKTCRLYFGIEIPEQEIPRVTLPPIPEFDENTFDTRFTQDKKLAANQDTIHVRNNAWPITATVEGDLTDEEAAWVLQIVEGLGRTSSVDDESYLTSHVLDGSKSIIIDGPVQYIILTKKEKTSIPLEFALHQNYPNPFNPITTINFVVEQSPSRKTSLQIFDITGRLVETLINKQLESGNHRVIWDASNVASGVYIYRLTSNRNQLTRKMVLLK